MKFQCSFFFFFLFNPDLAFCFLFFSQLLMACNYRSSHKLPQRNLLSISFQTKCIWLNMTGYTRCFDCRYCILDHVSGTTYCLYFQLWPLFSLVSDRLGGQVSEQKDAGTLDKVRKPMKKIWRNCRYSIFCCGQQYAIYKPREVENPIKKLMLQPPSVSKSHI